MIEFGALDDVSAIIAGHVDPTRDVGTIGIRSGVVTAHCLEIFIDITGRGGHAARPYETIDPVEIGMQFINRCYAALPRYGEPTEKVVLSYTAVHGGKYSNVIPEYLQVIGTMRSLEDEARNLAIQQIKAIASELSQSSGAKIEIRFGLIVPSMIANKQLTDFVRHIGADVLGENQVEEIPKPSMGGEDFAFILSNCLPRLFG